MKEMTPHGVTSGKAFVACGAGVAVDGGAVMTLDTEQAIVDLQNNLALVEKEHARLNEAEWALLQMLKRAVVVLAALDERTRAQGDGK